MSRLIGIIRSRLDAMDEHYNGGVTSLVSFRIWYCGSMVGTDDVKHKVILKARENSTKSDREYMFNDPRVPTGYDLCNRLTDSPTDYVYNGYRVIKYRLTKQLHDGYITSAYGSEIIGEPSSVMVAYKGQSVGLGAMYMRDYCLRNGNRLRAF